MPIERSWSIALRCACPICTRSPLWWVPGSKLRALYPTHLSRASKILHRSQHWSMPRSSHAALRRLSGDARGGIARNRRWHLIFVFILWRWYERTQIHLFSWINVKLQRDEIHSNFLTLLYTIVFPAKSPQTIQSLTPLNAFLQRWFCQWDFNFTNESTEIFTNSATCFYILFNTQRFLCSSYHHLL